MSDYFDWRNKELVEILRFGHENVRLLTARPYTVWVSFSVNARQIIP